MEGDKTDDRVVQAEDVVHIGPIGAQVAAIGSVNKPAIFELKSGESVVDLLRMAGGFNAVADRSRLTIERLDDRNASRIALLSLPADLNKPLQNGDLVRAFSAVDAALPQLRQNKRVRVEGEVLRPGEYVLPPESSILDALQAAGGLTSQSYIFGTEFNRESVRQSQQENYDRALRDLETEFARNSSTQKRTSPEEATAKAAGMASLFERMRAIRPTGRVVLQLEPDTTQLPALALEDGDRIYVPARSSTVGVFGSVFNGGSYLYGPGRSVGDFLRLAGGATRGADTRSTFVVRANGSVISARQTNSVFGLRDHLSVETALPGDTIFVPEELDKINVLSEMKDWAQIFYQFGLGVAALRTLKN
jgi:protein involved in polysaccharide export with SLBB domain